MLYEFTLSLPRPLEKGRSRRRWWWRSRRSFRGDAEIAREKILLARPSGVSVDNEVILSARLGVLVEGVEVECGRLKNANTKEEVEVEEQAEKDAR